MSNMKKEYVAPEYEVIKFDSQIMTGYFSPGCFGVVSVEFQGDDTPDRCRVTSGTWSNIMVWNKNYSD